MNPPEKPVFKKLLDDLCATGLVKVTGSYADGTNGDESDLDFFVKPDKPDTPFQERNIAKVIALCQSHGLHMDSSRIGYIYSHKQDNPMLPVPIEFSDSFHPRACRKKTVNIYGVEFSTH